MHRCTAWAFVGVVAASSVACASLTAEQQAAVSKVEIRSSDPALNCQNLGVVSGSRDGDGASSMRGRTVLMGGNTVRVDAKGIVSTEATAFYCPPPKADPDAEPAP